jgi:hypothetical protein
MIPIGERKLKLILGVIALAGAVVGYCIAIHVLDLVFPG